MGDGLPPEIQQSLIARLQQIESAPEPDHTLSSAIHQTLSVSGLHPAPDALLAAALTLPHGKSTDPAHQRCLLYLWLGRSPDHLLAVRWLGNQSEDPPPEGAKTRELISLISRLWPHTTPSGPASAAARTALRLEMARRTHQIITTHLKSHPLDEPLRKVLPPLATQLATDPAPDCATALRDVQTALAAGEKTR